MQRLLHDRPELRRKPVVICTPSPRGLVVLYRSVPNAAPRADVDANAREGSGRAIRPGMPLAEARSLQPDLHAEEIDPAAERRALKQVAESLGRFSPLVGLDDGDTPRSVLLDITGCAALFHGEARLLDEAVRELRRAGWDPRVAVADTIGAAWGLAQFGPCRTVLVPSGKTEPALRSLPIAALRIDPPIVARLSDLGVDSVARLVKLPRTQLAERFGSGVLRRVDQALGRQPELITPLREPPPVEATCPFEYPTDRRDVLALALDHLANDMHAALRDRDAGAKRLVCTLHHDAARPTHFEVELYRPSRSVKHLGMLLRDKLERVNVIEPVSAVSLRVSAAAPLGDEQAEFVVEDNGGGSRNGSSSRQIGLIPFCSAVGEAELASLIDQLTSRLGRGAVTRPALVADPQPEFACRFDPAINDVRPLGADRLDLSSAIDHLQSAKRPLRLWSSPVPISVTSMALDGPPAQFRCGGVVHRVHRSWGPERIEAGWWRDADVRRDYYVVENTAGARFWLFRGDGQWYLHGCFD
jgi:protein ImuB